MGFISDQLILGRDNTDLPQWKFQFSANKPQFYVHHWHRRYQERNFHNSLFSEVHDAECQF